MCRDQAYCYSYQRQALEAISESPPILDVLSGSRSVLRLLLEVPFRLANFGGGPMAATLPLLGCHPFSAATGGIDRDGGILYLAERGRKDQRTKPPAFLPTKGGEKRWKASREKSSIPLVHPWLGPPHGITPPTQWDRSHVSMIHNVRRGRRCMLTRTKFFCRMPGDGKQLLVLLTCSGAMIIAMSNPFRLGSVFFRRTLDRPSCNELDVIKFEHVHAVSRLPCHDTPRLLRSGFDSNFHRRRREEIYHRLRDDSAEGREAASTTPSRQPSSMVPTPTSAENGEMIDSDTTTPTRRRRGK